MDISDLLAFSVKNKASDLHLSSGLPPMIRVHGDLRMINLPAFDHVQVHAMLYDIMNDGQRKTFEETLECDFSFEIQNLARFRVNAFNQHRCAGAVFRTIPSITIMVALPLSIFGACLALWVFGESLSLPSIIGILMLSGIVGKNGILLLDCIIETIASGKSRHEAILEAAQQRAKPIVMTSVAMIAGMLPLLLGFGAGNAFREPMAVG